MGLLQLTCMMVLLFSLDYWQNLKYYCQLVFSKPIPIPYDDVLGLNFALKLS